MKHPQQRSRQDAIQDSRRALRRANSRAAAAALMLASAFGPAVPAAQAASPNADNAGASAPSMVEAARGDPPTPPGQNRHSLTLTLMNSQGGAPAPNTPYRLFVTGKDDAILDTPGGDGILHGVTDAQGRTAPARSARPHADEDFTLVRRIGDGPWGHFFQLRSSTDNAQLPAWPYIMTMRQRWGEQWVDLGYTNRQGATAYFSHDVPAASLSLSVDSPLTYDRPCFDELDAINRKFAQDDAQGARQRIAAMHCAGTPQQKLDLARLLLLAGQPDLARHWLMQARQRPFPAWLKPIDIDLLRERLMVERQLGMPDLVLADAMEIQARQAKRGHRPGGQDWANSTAYYLADFPDYLEQAEAQARQSIERVGARPYNQATLGWILTLRGRTDEGLRLMRSAYRDLPRDEEMVADYGLALWRDGQREQATRLWDEAQRQCVWGLRLHSALREAAYPHPYFQPSGSSAVQAYRDRCDGPRIKAKTWASGRA